MRASGVPEQLSFDELDTPLRDTTFVIVDLETTGGRPGEDAITEIGAVKVRGGEVIGEMATLVDPGRSIPPHIVEITGITTAMVVDAPRIERVLPAFLEFARGSVLVAHNAPFDTGFLQAAASATATPWPKFTVLCTVKLARRVLTRDEAPSVKLSSLARLFDVSTQPTHRALDDARATVDVLHALIDRVGNQGVHSLTELVDYLPDVSSHQRAKRTLASHLPHAPGVYLFRGPSDEVLYVGTATDLRRRVRNYFTGSETRGRMKEMVALTTRIDHVECSHALEAGVRELRLLAAHTPPYNRRSKYPKRGWWITLTNEAFPRLSVVRTPTRDSLGPFRSRSTAVEVAETLAEYCVLRTCTTRIPTGREHGPQCPPRELAPCPAAVQGLATEDDYRPGPRLFRHLLRGVDDTPLRRMRERLDNLAADELFENAARLRDRTADVALALRRMQRLAALTTLDEIVAARPAATGGWEFAVIRHGRLASSGRARRGAHPMPVVDALVLAAETVVPDDSPLRGASPEEAGLLARWLDTDGTRIVSASTGYCEPARGAGSWAEWCERARAGSEPTPEPESRAPVPDSVRHHIGWQA
ncbi:DEDD exonuclease domain-containing protein [Rhodococcus tibetensis]|uniref:DEDD exonuclease domain-containing protein n=1 Tax=Rhodococcus tibetensis TaxID=2965064 RepID=A0ABT1Q9T2_9NOCA|nr:DEDD exonuclease domain-containing protein [Rhodococcus sp. FXJ9.536]MCQ4119012.1 DEDD exonuclease domain-containing protein [Rhodococcus sp. FXJ9.536]